MPPCGAFYPNLNLIADGEDINAAVANRPIQQLLANTLYLNCLMAAAGTGQALVLSSILTKSDVLVGHAVYFDTGTSQFEKAIDNGSGKELVTGICINKPIATSGDFLIGGEAVVDMTNAGIGAIPTIGEYALDPSTAGNLVLAADTDPVKRVIVVRTNGDGRIFFQQRRNTAHNKTNSIAGTSADAYSLLVIENILDPGTVRLTVEVLGNINNTGGNSMTVREEVVDLDSNSDFVETVVATGQGLRLSTAADKFILVDTVTGALQALKLTGGALGVTTPSSYFPTARPPYVSYVVRVKSTTPGFPTGYSLNVQVNRS